MEHESLAVELLKEIKASARRWFIAFVVMCVLELLTVGGFIWYLSLPTSEEYYIEQEADNDSFNNVSGGDFTNGGKTESELQENKNNQK